jgi:hypothetical protein
MREASKRICSYRRPAVLTRTVDCTLKVAPIIQANARR